MGLLHTGRLGFRTFNPIIKLRVFTIVLIVFMITGKVCFLGLNMEKWSMHFISFEKKSRIRCSDWLGFKSLFFVAIFLIWNCPDLPGSTCFGYYFICILTVLNKRAFSKRPKSFGGLFVRFFLNEVHSKLLLHKIVHYE